MAIAVDIADRLYDYTDEEKAAEAVALFQLQNNLDDHALIALWEDERNPKRVELERSIFEAVDTNGSAKRAEETIPAGISLVIETEGA
ncbi:hypothetical protein [Asticcacaulis machinosus]|uniref:Uncharacterized protein n=1 Tax=Asticcacaulis machinosus TaxID=2984211 RepID=A0ABT5HG22_9CAUL|nr:hypothetical protein [Asticcacaulis machinosus]MDC7675132.1 hypothetical protein [Asticcacaulis machinosus]